MAGMTAAAPADPGLLLEPAAVGRVAEFLSARADAVDAGTASVRESVAFLNEALAEPGACGEKHASQDAGTSGPNADLGRVAATIATAAGEDMSAAFSLWCHRMVLEYVWCAPQGSPLRETTLPELLATRSLGSR